MDKVISDYWSYHHFKISSSSPLQNGSHLNSRTLKVVIAIVIVYIISGQWLILATITVTVNTNILIILI